MKIVKKKIQASDLFKFKNVTLINNDKESFNQALKIIHKNNYDFDVGYASVHFECSDNEKVKNNCFSGYYSRNPIHDLSYVRINATDFISDYIND